MNSLLLRATRQRVQSRLYESASLAHRMITIYEQILTTAIAQCETLDGLTSLTDELERLVRNPNELLFQFHSLSSKFSTIPLGSGALTVSVTPDNMIPPDDEIMTDESIYEFMTLYESEEVVDCRNMKDAADTILDELSAGNTFDEEDPHEEDATIVYEDERQHLPVIEPEIESIILNKNENDVITNLLMNSFIVSDTNIPKRKNKSPRSGDTSRTSPGKCDNEKKRGRPPVSLCDRKPKVKKIKALKKEVNELSDCDEEIDR